MNELYDIDRIAYWKNYYIFSYNNGVYTMKKLEAKKADLENKKQLWKNSTKKDFFDYTMNVSGLAAAINTIKMEGANND